MTAPAQWWDFGIRLITVALCAGALGLDRERRGHVAGLRTMILVGLAACGIMEGANALLLSHGPVPHFVRIGVMRMPEGVLSGIGFIGAGAIIQRGGGIHGVTTAALLWVVSSIGLLTGAGFYGLGIGLTVLTLIVIYALERLEARLPRRHRANLTLVCGQRCPPRHEIEFILPPQRFLLEPQCESRSERGGEIRFAVSWYATVEEDHGSALQALRMLSGVREARWERRGPF